MFDSNKTFTARIAGGLDLLIDVATLGEYGLEAVETPVQKHGCDRNRRSHTSAKTTTRPRGELCKDLGLPAPRVAEVVHLDRFLSPRASSGEKPVPKGPKVGGHGTTLAPVIPINARVAEQHANSRVTERRACPEVAPAPGYKPCTPAARRIALAA